MKNTLSSVIHYCPVCDKPQTQTIFFAGKIPSDRKIVLHQCAECLLISNLYVPPVNYNHGAESLQDKENQYLSGSAKYRKYSAEFISNAKRFINNGKVLDIGCDVGFILDAFQDYGFQTYGIEPGAGALVAKRRHQIYHGEFLDAGLTERFDLIIMNHVLEHIPDPAQLLRFCKKQLTISGYLIITVPLIESLMFKIKRGNWYGLGPDQHLWHWTPNTLSTLLRKQGYKTTGIIHSMMDWDDSARAPWKQAIVNLLVWISKRTRTGDQFFIVASPQ